MEGSAERAERERLRATEAEEERIVEVVCQKTSFEVPASAGGVLVETLRAFDEPVEIGEVIGWIDPKVAPWVVPIPERRRDLTRSEPRPAGRWAIRF